MSYSVYLIVSTHNFTFHMVLIVESFQTRELNI